ILQRAAGEAAWHLYYRCEWCEYFTHCRDEALRIDDLSRLATLSATGKRHLLQLGVRTVSALGTFLQREDADTHLQSCASLAGEKHYLANRASALNGNTVVAHGAGAHALPAFCDVGVLLTLQREPLGGATYLAGMVLSCRKELHDPLRKLLDED